MTPRHLIRLGLALAVLLCCAGVAGATDSHDYARDEYLVIRDGLSPDRRLSLASHAGSDPDKMDFHIWLMAEPAHRRLVTLDGIGSSNNLDTGPDAYHATWSPDSRHVAVWWRSDRHAAELNIYAIVGHGSRLVLGPSPFRDVTNRDFGPRGSKLLSGYSEITWLSPTRFVLKEHRVLVTKLGFLKALGRFGKLQKWREDEKYFMEFSAEAICQLLPGHRYRIVDIKLGEFKD